jgi:hypothetical protein
MKIYLTPPQPSRGLQRIESALRRYAPVSVEIVDNEDDADLVVLYAIGRVQAITARAEWLTSLGKKYAVIQCCLRSTQKPHVYDWYDLWDESSVTWSYYDLNRACEEDDSNYRVPNFHHAPLGVDPAIFYPRDELRHLAITTTGLSYLSESVRECWLAARQSFKSAAHLGPVRQRGHRVEVFNDLGDDQVAQLYSSSKFVSGLRRKEGFELPAAEGLCCGARPILFDTYDYRKWYEPWGIFIREGSRQEVIDQLTQIFLSKYEPVTEQEIAAARERFNWERIVGGFYGRCLG